MNEASKPIVVAGSGAMLRACAEALTRSGAAARAVELIRSGGSGYDLAPLAAYPPDRWMAFAAVGSELLNLLRLGLMSGLRQAGYRLAGIVSPSASVPAGWRPPENVFVDDHAVVGAGVAMRHNVVVGAGAIIGAKATLGHSIWIGPGAILGPDVAVGDGTIIASGCIVGDGVKVGRQCELAIARHYRVDVPNRSFHSPLFDEVARIRSSISDADARN